MPTIDSPLSHSKRPPNGPAARIWTLDMTLLASLTVSLWIITLIWQAIDLDRLAGQSIRSESDAWLFALTLAPLYFALKGIAASWGLILGIPTCLMAGHLALCRFQRKRRWLVVGSVTALLFIGVPIILNHLEEGRLADRYKRSDAAPFPGIAGRAVELPDDTVIPSISPGGRRCDDTCLELLTFGGATSVIYSFPDRQGAPARPVATYRLGPVGPDCAGPTLIDVCPHAAPVAMPQDRVIMTVGPVERDAADAPSMLARRLHARDMRRPDAPPATLTRFVFTHHPGLLNPLWHNGSFHLPREQVPVLGNQALDTRLYRDVAGNVFRGHVYPFR